MKQEKLTKDLQFLMDNVGKLEDIYIATPSYHNKFAAAFGTNPVQVYKMAKMMGHDEPVLIYLQKPDLVYILDVDESEMHGVPKSDELQKESTRQRLRSPLPEWLDQMQPYR